MTDFSQLKQKAMQDEEFQKEWNKQMPFWNLQKQLIKTRLELNLTQETIAQRMHTKQSVIEHFETDSKSCDFATICAYAKALGLKEITIKL